MDKMIKDGRLPDGQGLIGCEKCGELVGTEGAERHAKKTEKTCDLSGKLHKQGMMAVHTALFNP
jgi:hypothetical protein